MRDGEDTALIFRHEYVCCMPSWRNEGHSQVTLKRWVCAFMVAPCRVAESSQRHQLITGSLREVLKASHGDGLPASVRSIAQFRHTCIQVHDRLNDFRMGHSETAAARCKLLSSQSRDGTCCSGGLFAVCAPVMNTHGRHSGASRDALESVSPKCYSHNAKHLILPETW